MQNDELEKTQIPACFLWYMVRSTVVAKCFSSGLHFHNCTRIQKNTTKCDAISHITLYYFSVIFCNHIFNSISQFEWNLVCIDMFEIHLYVYGRKREHGRNGYLSNFIGILLCFIHILVDCVTKYMQNFKVVDYFVICYKTCATIAAKS